MNSPYQRWVAVIILGALWGWMLGLWPYVKRKVIKLFKKGINPVIGVPFRGIKRTVKFAQTKVQNCVPPVASAVELDCNRPGRLEELVKRQVFLLEKVEQQLRYIENHLESRL